MVISSEVQMIPARKTMKVQMERQEREKEYMFQKNLINTLLLSVKMFVCLRGIHWSTLRIYNKHSIARKMLPYAV